MGVATGWQDGAALVGTQVSALYQAEPPRVRRRRLASRLVSAARSGAPVTLCACRGAGATSLLRDAAALWREEGGEVRFVSLRGAPAADVPALLRRARECLAGVVAPTLLLVDDMPGLEEFTARDAACELELLARLVPTVCATGPDGELLVEALGEHPAWDTSELGVRYDEVEHWRVGDLSTRGFQELTGGVVSLAEALRADMREGRGVGGPRYQEQRARMLCVAVEGALIGEERRLRGAMALLGTGTFGQLRGLGLACSHELVSSTCAEAPALGVERSGGRFSIVGGALCPEPVAELCGRLWPDLACEVVSLHMEEGRLAQAIAVAAGCVDAPELEKVLSGRWVELWDAGGRSLMEELAARSPQGLAAAALAVLSGDAKAEPPDRSPCWEPVRALREVGALGGATGLSRGDGVRALRFCGAPPDDALTTSACVAGLWDLWESRRALAAGDLAGALGVTSRGLGSVGDESVVGALLAQDRYLAEAGLGHDTRGSRSRAEDGLRLLCDRGGPLGPREAARHAVADLVVGRPVSADVFSQALGVAVSHGDLLGRGCALIGQGLRSFEAGDFSAAHSRGCEAARLGEGCACAPLREGGAALSLMAELSLGLEPHVEAPLVSPDLCLLAECAVPVEEGPASARLPAHRDATPRGMSLALLRGALSRPGRAQDRLWAALPGSWREAHGARTTEPVAVGVQLPLPVGVSADAPLLEVDLLGGLSVRLDGRVVDPAKFRRTGSRHLLAILAVRSGHQITRAELAAELWPELPPERGRRNLYSIVSCARRGLGEREYGPCYLLSTRDLIAFNADTTVVDLDGFEALLERARAADATDAERVALAERASSRYRGGSYLPEGAEPRALHNYHDWLESRYVECLLTGARSALRLRRPHVARGFAREAAERAPLLEEAARLLMEALVREGRPLEAQGAFNAFVRAANEAGLPVPEGLVALREGLAEELAAPVGLVA